MRYTFLYRATCWRWLAAAGWLAAAVLARPLPGQASGRAWRQTATPALSDTLRLRELLRQCERAAPGTDIRPYARQGLRQSQGLALRPWRVKFLLALTQAEARRENLVGATGLARQALAEAARPPALALGAARAEGLLGSLGTMSARYAAARQSLRAGLAWAGQAPPSLEQQRVQASLQSALSSAFSGPLLERNAPVAATDSLLRGGKQAARRTLRLAQALGAAGDQESYRGNLANSLDNLADLALLEHQYDTARYYKRRAVALYDALGAPEVAAARRQHLANLEWEAGRYPAAAAAARVAIVATHRLQMPLVEADSYEILANALDSLHRPRAALRAWHRFQALRDSVLSADNAQALDRLQLAADTERKEARIRELTQQRRAQQAEVAYQRQRAGLLLGGLLALALALAGGGVLYVRLRRSRAALAALGATKDRLYALVAHDLRGPVHALGGLGNLIGHYLRHQNQRQLAELPTLVSQAVAGINQLLDNLLHWAASQSGELHFRPAPQPLAAVLGEVAELWRTTAQADQIRLVLPTDVPAAATVWADAQMLHTVLRNLVGNALKFTPGGGTVALEAQPGPGAGYTLRVRDTGPGLSPAEAAALLALAAASPRRPGARGERGTGLGLPLCQLFMQRHGGTLALHSRPGGGTTAELWFPGGPAGAGAVLAPPAGAGAGRS